MVSEPIVGLPKDVLKDVRIQLLQAMAILKQTENQLVEKSSAMDEALAIAGANKLLELTFSDLDLHATRL